MPLDIRKVVHNHHHYVDEKLILETISELKEFLMAHLDEIKAAVAANTATIDSAVLLLNSLGDKLEEIKDDPEQIAALAGELRAKSGELGQAVVNNTPVA